MALVDIGDGWVPTSQAINALPEPLRRYIHDLEMRYDPPGDIRLLAVQRDTIKMLEIKLLEEREAVAVMSALVTWALCAVRWGRWSRPPGGLRLRERAAAKGLGLAEPPRRYRWRWWMDDWEEMNDE